MGTVTDVQKYDLMEQEMRIAREHIEWCDIWVPSANVDIDKPRVLLVGDSITRGYYPPTNKLVSETISLARHTTSACVSDPVFLVQFAATVNQYDFSVIHFNNGLHGIDYTEEEYLRGYELTLQWIKEHSPESKLVLVLSTPLQEGSDKEHLNARMDVRNLMVRDLAETFDADINDMNTPMLGHPEYYCDPCHYKPEAIEIQAKQVVETIKALV